MLKFVNIQILTQTSKYISYIIFAKKVEKDKNN